MMNLVNDQFGYLIACIERPEDPPGAMPNSLSFPNVKDLFGKHFAVNLMESTVNEKGVKDHTFLLLSDKVKCYKSHTIEVIFFLASVANFNFFCQKNIVKIFRICHLQTSQFTKNARFPKWH